MILKSSWIKVADLVQYSHHHHRIQNIISYILSSSFSRLTSTARHRSPTYNGIMNGLEPPSSTDFPRLLQFHQQLFRCSTVYFFVGSLLYRYAEIDMKIYLSRKIAIFLRSISYCDSWELYIILIQCTRR